MSDEFEGIVDNIKERSVWIRILFMIGFAIAAYIVIVPLILVLTIAQALFTVVTGQGNANLRYFSATLALYVNQLIEFLTYLSEVKPYPFSELPEVEDDSLQAQSVAKSANKQESKKQESKKPAAAKKKAVKKKAVKKAAKKKAPKTAEKSEPESGGEGASDS